tara:strand:+ start:566 stop:1246 length:681 start_codon:yes stop_codon:yes gene_type:complete
MTIQNISLIIPSKNEKESLEKTLLEISHYKFINEVLIIVDDKKDNSINIAKKFNTRIIVQKKKGYGAAIIKGFSCATNKFGCIFNADYSFNPKDLKLMMRKTDRSSFIFGSRYMLGGSSDDDTIVTYVGNKIFSFMTRVFLKIKISDVLLTYVLCNVAHFKKLKLTQSDFRLCIELPAKVENYKFNYTEIASKERKRFSGKKKVNELKDGFLILIEILRFFFKKQK